MHGDDDRFEIFLGFYSLLIVVRFFVSWGVAVSAHYLLFHSELSTRVGLLLFTSEACCLCGIVVC